MKLVLENANLETPDNLGALSYDEVFERFAQDIDDLNLRQLSGQNILAITKLLKRLAEQLYALREREQAALHDGQNPIPPLPAEIRQRVEAAQTTDPEPMPSAKGLAAQLAERMGATIQENHEPELSETDNSNQLSPMATESGWLGDFLLSQVHYLTQQPTRQQFKATIVALKETTKAFSSLSTLVNGMLIPSLEQAKDLKSEPENLLTSEEKNKLALSDYEIYLEMLTNKLETGLEQMGLDEEDLDLWLGQIGNFMQERKPEYLADVVAGHAHFEQTKRALFKELVPELVMQTPHCGKDQLSDIQKMLQLD